MPFLPAVIRPSWLCCLTALVGLLTTALPTRANHSVGGELELLHLTGEQYLIRVNLYIDNNAQAPPEGTLIASFFEKGTNRRLQNVTVSLLTTTTVAYTNPSCTGGGLNTSKRVYQATVNLPTSTYSGANGYYVAVEHCCRNDATTNIQNPSNAGQTFYLEFAAVMQGGQAFLDSTPTDFPPLSNYACLGELFTFEFGGTDPDGDSLTYDMVAPLQGHATRNSPRPAQAGTAPYAAVTWNAGLSTAYQVPGNPTMGVDAHTGVLHVRPTQLGLYVFGVRCRAYRRGVKISETWRDYQLYVLRCPANATPAVQVQSNAQSPRVYIPGTDTLYFRPNAERCMQIRYTDPDQNASLQLSLRAVNFTDSLPTFTTASSGVVHTAGGPDTLTATLCFSPCFDTKGNVWLLDIVVTDNGCGSPKRDTVRVAFVAESIPNVPPVLTSSLPPPTTPDDATPIIIRVPLGSTYTATLDGTDADANPLTLSATGDGFDLGAAGMMFASQNGAGQANGTFSWLATCDAIYLRRPLTVNFRLQENACRPQPQHRTVRFEVITTPDTVTFLPPNVITPNGDGQNDYFEMPDLPADVCDVRFATIKIFSRWGNEVFSSSERGFQWGGIGSAATYYYLITYTDGQRFKGWLEVLPGR